MSNPRSYLLFAHAFLIFLTLGAWHDLRESRFRCPVRWLVLSVLLGLAAYPIWVARQLMIMEGPR
jgi:hypothetical protein